MKIAGFEKRIVAWIIDYVLAALISGLIFYFFNRNWKLNIASSMLIFQWIVIVIYIFISFLELVILKDKTLGMLFLGTRLVYVHSNALPTSAKLIRSLLLGVISMCIINAIYMLVIHSERTIFDKLSNTIVVNRKNT